MFLGQNKPIAHNPQRLRVVRSTFCLLRRRPSGGQSVARKAMWHEYGRCVRSKDLIQPCQRTSIPCFESTRRNRFIASLAVGPIAASNAG